MAPFFTGLTRGIGGGGFGKKRFVSSMQPLLNVPNAFFSTTTSLLFNGTTYNVGDSLQGGYFGGFISSTGDGIATHAIIVAPKSTGESSSKQWNNGSGSDPSYTLFSEWDGLTNSNLVNDANHPAANFCRTLSIGGYSDWYLPGVSEMNVLYRNLKPTTDSNNTDPFSGYRRIGANTYGVTGQTTNWPSGGPPTQTSVTDFKSGGAQAFASQNYWTSTKSPSVSMVTTMTDGAQFNTSGWDPYPNTTSLYVRAARKLTSS